MDTTTLVLLVVLAVSLVLYMAAPQRRLEPGRLSRADSLAREHRLALAVTLLAGCAARGPRAATPQPQPRRRCSAAAAPATCRTHCRSTCRRCGT